ncbi:MAG: TIR domain-containing protein [Anaerolineales bacterium]|nr:TIR domain-containing protein [Anaerolineales bacterium]
MTTNRPLRVFLCHSSNDKPAVRELYQKLRAEPWISPWLDKEELYPGQDWNLEIEKAIEITDVIIVCLSNSSITKEGYIKKEIKVALDYSDYKPEGTVFIIPVRLEECKPPNRLLKWQYTDYFGDSRETEFRKLQISLRKRAIALGLISDNSVIKDVDGEPIENLVFDAIEFLRTNEANTSLLQSKFRLNLVDATRLLNQLEEMGVVGPDKGRDVYLGDSDLEEDDFFD